MATVQASGVVSGRGVFWRKGKGKAVWPYIQVFEAIESPVPGKKDIRVWTCRLSAASDAGIIPYLTAMKWVAVTGQFTVTHTVAGSVTFLLTRCVIQLGPRQTTADDPVYAALAERAHFNAPRTEKTIGDQVDAISLEEDAKLLPG